MKRKGGKLRPTSGLATGNSVRVRGTLIGELQVTPKKFSAVRLIDPPTDTTRVTRLTETT
jgi:hypothetical protein